MSKGIGKLIRLGIARETNRGTAESAATYWIPHIDFDIFDKRQYVNDEASVGVIEDSVNASIVKEWAEGSLKAPIGDKSFPLVLYSILGSLSTADNPDTDPTVKDHTITVGQSAQHQSLTIFKDDPLAAQDYKYALGVIQQLEIRYELGKFLEFTAGFKSKKGATATLTPAAPSENKFLPQHLTFKLASAQSGLDAAAATVIKALTLKINENVEDDDVLGSKEPADFLNKQFAIEGTLEAIWQNITDFQNAALAGTLQAMRIDLKNTDVTIGAAANPQIKIDLHKVSFQEITAPVAIHEIVKQTLSFKGHYHTTDAKMITTVATNTAASY